MIYRSIFFRAWNIVWQHAGFWIAGIFVSPFLLGGELRPLFQLLYGLKNQANYLDTWLSDSMLVTTWNLYQAILQTNSLENLLWTLLLIVSLVAVVWWLFMAQGVLIQFIDHINRHQKVNLAEAIQGGFHRSPQIFSLFLIGRIGIGVLLLLVSFPLIFLFFNPGDLGSQSVVLTSTVFLFLVVTLYVPLAIIVNLITNYATCFTVLYHYNVRDALKGGWQLFRRHWLESLEWGLLLLIIDLIAATFVIILLQSFFSGPGALSALLVYAGTFWTVLLIGAAFMVILGTIGWLTAFHQTVWVLLFERFTINYPANIVSWIHRIATAVISLIGKLIGWRDNVKDDLNSELKS